MGKRREIRSNSVSSINLDSLCTIYKYLHKRLNVQEVGSQKVCTGEDADMY